MEVFALLYTAEFSGRLQRLGARKHIQDFVASLQTSAAAHFHKFLSPFVLISYFYFLPEPHWQLCVVFNLNGFFYLFVNIVLKCKLWFGGT